MKHSDFEANFTAWLDGELAPEKVAAFEEEMLARGFDPVAERTAAEQTSALLTRHSASPEMGNVDFFHHQLMHRLQQGESEPRAARAWWTFPRLVWAGAFCLLMAGLFFKTMIPTGGGAPLGDDYFASIVDARTYEPTISVDTVYDARNNVTVLWLDGLDYLPTDIVR